MAEITHLIGKMNPEQVELTVRITGQHELRARLAIGLWLIKLGCRVIGLGMKVEMPSEPPTVPPVQGATVGAA